MEVLYKVPFKSKEVFTCETRKLNHVYIHDKMTLENLLKKSYNKQLSDEVKTSESTTCHQLKKIVQTFNACVQRYRAVF